MRIYSPSFFFFFFLHKMYRAVQTALHLLSFVLNNATWRSAPIGDAQPVLGWSAAANCSPGGQPRISADTPLAAVRTGCLPVTMHLSLPVLPEPESRLEQKPRGGRENTPEVQPWEKVSCLSSEIIRPIRRRGFDLGPCFLLSEVHTVS